MKFKIILALLVLLILSNELAWTQVKTKPKTTPKVSNTKFTQMLSRNWKLNLEQYKKDTYAKVSPAEKAQAMSNKGPLIETFKKQGASVFEFKANGDYGVFIQGTIVDVGVWQMTADGKSLTIKSKNEGIRKFKITQLSPSQMILVNLAPKPKQAAQFYFVAN